MKEFHIPTFNHNMMLRNLVGILTSEVCVRITGNCWHTRGRRLIRGLLTEVRSGSREKLRGGEAPRISNAGKSFPLLSLYGEVKEPEP